MKDFLKYKAIGPWNRLCLGQGVWGHFSHWWWNSPSQGCCISQIPLLHLLIPGTERSFMAAKKLVLFRVGIPDVFPWRRKRILIKGCLIPGLSGAGSPAPCSVAGIQGGTELTEEWTQHSACFTKNVLLKKQKCWLNSVVGWCSGARFFFFLSHSSICREHFCGSPSGLALQVWGDRWGAQSRWCSRAPCCLQPPLTGSSQSHLQAPSASVYFQEGTPRPSSVGNLPT